MTKEVEKWPQLRLRPPLASLAMAQHIKEVERTPELAVGATSRLPRMTQHNKQSPELKRIQQSPNLQCKSTNKEESGGPKHKIAPENNLWPENKVRPPFSIYIYIIYIAY